MDTNTRAHARARRKTHAYTHGTLTCALSLSPSLPPSLSSYISPSLSLSFSQTFEYHHHAQLDEIVNSALEKGEYKATTGLEVMVRGDVCSVENIVSYSPAWFCQRIEIGDQLVTVDGVHVTRKHYQKMLIGDGQKFSFLVVGLDFPRAYAAL
jgi:hypothetical protein